MADPRFFAAQGPFDLAELAVIAKADLAPGADGARRVVDIAPLEAAGGETISFLDNRRYIEAFTRSHAGACIIAPEVAQQAPQGMALLLTPEPYRAFARVARAFYPPARVKPGIAEAAVIDAEAILGPDCRVDAGAVIGAHCEIGARCHIGANAVIEAGVVMGEDCIVGACASLSHCRMGDRVTIYPGARIGQEGFGFAPSPAGHLRIPHTGRVIIGDDAEVGANSTIDRGSGPDTIIGAGQQQAAHVLDRPDAAADGERHEALFRRRPRHLQDDGAVVGGGGDVEEAELVRPLSVVDLGLSDGIAGVAQVDEVDALDHATVLHVEAGDDPLGQHARAPSPSRSASAAFGSSRPS